MLDRIIATTYRIVRILGAGGMGVVCEAEHQRTGKRVALKVIAPRREGARDPFLAELFSDGKGSVSTHGEAVARFQREARAAGSVDTQHVVQVFDAGVDEKLGLPYLAMELLKGESLADLLDRTGPLEPDSALRIAAQTCLGLAKAHDAGVVHRDIKPANLFLHHREDGEVIVKVLDFGIAKMIESAEDGTARDLTRTGGILGSPRYMAPEQAKSLRTVDHRADLWSLGVVLYRALSGRTPHQEVEVVQLLLAVCTRAPIPLQTVAPWVEPAIAELVHRALAMDPAQRFATAQAMGQAACRQLPNGFRLSPEQLEPLSPQRRSHRAAVLDMGPPEDGESTLTASATGMAPEAKAAAANASSEGASTSEAGAWPKDGSTGAPKAPRRARLRRAIPWLALLAAGATGVTLMAAQSGGSLPTAEALDSTGSDPVADPSPSAVTAASSPASAAAVEAPAPSAPISEEERAVPSAPQVHPPAKATAPPPPASPAPASSASAKPDELDVVTTLE